MQQVTPVTVQFLLDEYGKLYWHCATHVDEKALDRLAYLTAVIWSFIDRDNGTTDQPTKDNSELVAKWEALLPK